MQTKLNPTQVLSAKDEIAQLIEQLAYLDHESNTDVATHLTDTIIEIKTTGLSKSEATELLADRLKLLRLNSVLTTDEQLRLVEAVIDRLPGLLFA